MMLLNEYDYVGLQCDGNKTKILRPRPRPIKQQPEYIVIKNNFVQKRHKSDDH